MKILARTIKGQEFMYARENVVIIPKTWSKKTVALTIDGINKIFHVSENETYYRYEIDNYSNIIPTYEVYRQRGVIKMRRARK